MFASDFDQNPGVSSVSGISGVSQMKRFSFSLKLVFSFRPVRPVRLFLKKFRGIRDICVRPIHLLTCRLVDSLTCRPQKIRGICEIRVRANPLADPKIKVWFEGVRTTMIAKGRFFCNHFLHNPFIANILLAIFCI